MVPKQIYSSRKGKVVQMWASSMSETMTQNWHTRYTRGSRTCRVDGPKEISITRLCIRIDPVLVGSTKQWLRMLNEHPFQSQQSVLYDWPCILMSLYINWWSNINAHNILCCMSVLTFSNYIIINDNDDSGINIKGCSAFKRLCLYI